jgi:hypothetical protein
MCALKTKHLLVRAWKQKIEAWLQENEKEEKQNEELRRRSRRVQSNRRSLEADSGKYRSCVWKYLVVMSRVFNNNNKKKTTWPQSSSELYRSRDRRLSAKLAPTFVDRGCCVVSTTDPYGHIHGFLHRNHYFFFQVAPQLYSRGWVDPVPDPLLLRKFGSRGGIEPGPLNL